VVRGEAETVGRASGVSSSKNNRGTAAADPTGGVNGSTQFGGRDVQLRTERGVIDDGQSAAECDPQLECVCDTVNTVSDSSGHSRIRGERK
jgi:hypothetical protein